MAGVRGYMLAAQGVSGVILCGREYMNSLADSSMEEIKQAIKETPWLHAQYDIGENYIRTKCRRVSFVFAGLRHNLDSIKSKARILLAWVDEAESVSDVAWSKLIPTIRGIEEAELWVTWNPEKKESPTDIRFRLKAAEDAKIVEMNYQDNPWFPKVLDRARLEDKRIMNESDYRWIWEGAYHEHSDAQIFANKYRVADFEPQANWDGPYNGLDFGFAQDPTAAVKSWVYQETLYIEHEAGKVGLELDDTSQFIEKKIPSFGDYVIRADSARPESISYLKRFGMPKIVGVEKGKGSVEDGIEFIKSFREVVIHTRCKETAKEFSLYSYKVDRLTQDVLPVPVDSWNHYIDALRYALQPLMKARKFKPISISFIN
jgi:phage terminase large subunit